MHPPPSTVDPTRLLTRRELATVLADVTEDAHRFANSRRNLVIVRLACCCGLRVSEIAGLQLDDVVADVPRAHLRLRKETTKGKKPHCVPLWWDAGTLADLIDWKAERLKRGARGNDPFIAHAQDSERKEVRARPGLFAKRFEDARLKLSDNVTKLEARDTEAMLSLILREAGTLVLDPLVPERLLSRCPPTKR
jgi:integrase